MSYYKSRELWKLMLQKKENRNDIFKYFLGEGYYPESDILPPCFMSENFEYRHYYYYPLNKKKKILKGLKPSVPVTLSIPKTNLSDRDFGIIAPDVYHDIVKHLLSHSKKISSILFNKKNKINTYSLCMFSKSYLKNIGGENDIVMMIKRRAGTQINQYIEAENEMLKESSKYRFLLQTDIKSFYPSIYTHAIARVLRNGKNHSRTEGNDMSILGNVIDKLLLKAHDNCTNGIIIGPAITDFISELLLERINTQVSIILKKEGLDDYLAIRYKDDYKIMLKSKSDAELFLKVLNDQLKIYKLQLHEGKTSIKTGLPEIILRPWIIKSDMIYRKFIEERRENNILVSKSKIGIKKFKELYFESGYSQWLATECGDSRVGEL